MTRNALGRGLGALIREPEPLVPAASGPGSSYPITPGGAAVASARDGAPTGPLQIDIDLIEPSPFQPRTRFREEALEELMRSIQASGIIQPLVVRPIGSRFGAIASNQSSVIASRERLEEQLREVCNKYEGKEPPAPKNWGGYRLVPTRFEFWQGRENRLHDRFLYTRQPDGSWRIDRLSP